MGSDKAGVVVQQVKLLLGMLTSHIRMPLLSIQFPADIHPGRQQMMFQSTWVPVTQVGDPNGVPGSWLSTGPAMTVAGSEPV